MPKNQNSRDNLRIYHAALLALARECFTSGSLPNPLKLRIILDLIDELEVGTPDYMGRAEYWHSEFEFLLGYATKEERVDAHSALIKAGLHPSGGTVRHLIVIDRTISRGRSPQRRKGLPMPVHSR